MCGLYIRIDPKVIYFEWIRFLLSKYNLFMIESNEITVLHHSIFKIKTFFDF